jgi:hypothetical protein
MRKLYSPENDAELALIKSVFDGEGIKYFVHNDHFGSLKVGPKIDLFNAKTIVVPDDQYERANEIIQDFISNRDISSEDETIRISLKDKIRMIVEAVLFSWFMPGKKWHKKSEGKKT